MEQSVRALLQRHAANFNAALAGRDDLEETAAVFAEAFLAATPAGVMTGRNDDSLRQAIGAGNAHYRATGALGMKIRDVAVTPIDDLHAMAKVGWRARYRRKDGSETDIDFDVTYLVQALNGDPKIFAWISGDEEAALKGAGVG